MTHFYGARASCWDDAEKTHQVLSQKALQKAVKILTWRFRFSGRHCCKSSSKKTESTGPCIQLTNASFRRPLHLAWLPLHIVCRLHTVYIAFNEFDIYCKVLVLPDLSCKQLRLILVSGGRGPG